MADEDNEPDDDAPVDDTAGALLAALDSGGVTFLNSSTPPHPAQKRTTARRSTTRPVWPASPAFLARASLSPSRRVVWTCGRVLESRGQLFDAVGD